MIDFSTLFLSILIVMSTITQLFFGYSMYLMIYLHIKEDVTRKVYIF